MAFTANQLSPDRPPINQASFGLVVTKHDDVVVDDERLICMPLSTFMLLR